MGQVDVITLNPSELNKLLIFYKKQGGHLKGRAGRNYILFGGQQRIEERKDED